WPRAARRSSATGPTRWATGAPPRSTAPTGWSPMSRRPCAVSSSCRIPAGTRPRPSPPVAGRWSIATRIGCSRDTSTRCAPPRRAGDRGAGDVRAFRRGTVNWIIPLLVAWGVLTLPGWLLLRAAGARVPIQWGWAPPVTVLAIVALTGLYRLLGIPWHAVTVAAGVLVLVGALRALRRWRL